MSSGAFLGPAQNLAGSYTVGRSRAESLYQVNITKAQCQLCTGFHWALIQASASNPEPKEMNLHLWNAQIQREVLAAGKARLVASQWSEPGK